MELKPSLKNYKDRSAQLYGEDGAPDLHAEKGLITAYNFNSLEKGREDTFLNLSRKGQSGSKFRMKSTSKGRAELLNRFLWKDYSKRKMEVSTANAAHIVMRFETSVMVPALEKSIDLLLGRHDVLNSFIEMSGGRLYLVQRPGIKREFQEIMVEGKNSVEREKNAICIARDLTWKEYDLDSGPLYRVFFLRISSSDCILGAGLHHSIGDMISVSIFYRELINAYNALIGDGAPELSPARFQYMDYLASMEEWAAAGECAAHMKYWTECLRSVPVTDLVPGMNFSIEKSSGGSSAVKKIVLDSVLTRGLRKIGSELRKTLFCLLLAVHNITVWKMTGREELVIAALHAGRINPDFQNMIGNFSMETAYKTNFSGNPPFTEMAERVSSSMNDSLLHQPVPLEWVRRALSNNGILFRAPGMSFIPDSTERKGPISRQLKFDPPGMFQGFHGPSLSYNIEFRDCRETIEGSMRYRKDLYCELTVRTFLEHFRKNVLEVINAPYKKLYDFKRDLNFTYY